MWSFLNMHSMLIGQNYLIACEFVSAGAQAIYIPSGLLPDLAKNHISLSVLQDSES